MHRKLLTVVIPLVAFAQTKVDLQNQSKTVDFTAASFTRPVKTGTSLPATCSVGDLFFNTASGAGTNLYGCVATNTGRSSPEAGAVVLVLAGLARRHVPPLRSAAER